MPRESATHSHDPPISPVPPSPGQNLWYDGVDYASLLPRRALLETGGEYNTVRRRALRRLLPALLVLLLLVVPREGHASSARHARSPGARLTGVAGWAGGFPSFNVLSAPRPDAPVVATLQPGEQVHVLT